MNQMDIAKQMGIHPNALSMIINDHRPISPRTAKKIADYFGQEDWRRFVEMPGSELRRELLTKMRIPE